MKIIIMEKIQEPNCIEYCSVRAKTIKQDVESLPQRVYNQAIIGAKWFTKCYHLHILPYHLYIILEPVAIYKYKTFNNEGVRTCMTWHLSEKSSVHCFHFAGDEKTLKCLKITVTTLCKLLKLWLLDFSFLKCVWKY